jgi:hypothetical protein
MCRLSLALSCTLTILAPRPGVAQSAGDVAAIERAIAPRIPGMEVSTVVLTPRRLGLPPRTAQERAVIAAALGLPDVRESARQATVTCGTTLRLCRVNGAEALLTVDVRPFMADSAEVVVSVTRPSSSARAPLWTSARTWLLTRCGTGWVVVRAVGKRVT